MSVETPEPVASLDQKLVKSSPILWILAAVLFGLLSTLGTQGLSDIADAVRSPDTEALNQQYLGDLEQQRRSLDTASDPHREAITRAEQELADDERVVRTAEENFRTWLETRATVGGQATEDAEIRTRRDQLARLRDTRDARAAALTRLRAEPDPLEAQRKVLEAKLVEARSRYEAALAAEQRVWTLKVLALRLLLVAPVWIIAAVLWRRRARSKYVTLLWGYWAFAVWMLFWGVEPYLPHYGGYAPLSIGVALTIWASVSLVRWFNRRVAVRRQRLVEKNIARHRCPGCERGYLVGRESSLILGLARKANQRQFDTAALRPRACPFCGLRLFGACAQCGHEQPVHLEHCAACQAAWREAPLTAPSASAAT